MHREGKIHRISFPLNASKESHEGIGTLFLGDLKQAAFLSTRGEGGGTGLKTVFVSVFGNLQYI